MYVIIRCIIQNIKMNYQLNNTQMQENSVIYFPEIRYISRDPVVS